MFSADFVAWAKTHVVTKELLGVLDETKKREQKHVDPKRLSTMHGAAGDDAAGQSLRDERIQSRVQGKQLLEKMAEVGDVATCTRTPLPASGWPPALPQCPGCVPACIW